MCSTASKKESESSVDCYWRLKIQSEINLFPLAAKKTKRRRNFLRVTPAEKQ